MSTEGDLIDRLRTGDRAAWPLLLRRFAPLVHVVARSHRLDLADTADVVQNTWTALAEHLPALSRPERLRAWIVTTARRECVRVRERRGRELPAPGVPDRTEPGPERRLVGATGERALRRAVDRLPDRCRRLLRLQANAPEMTYAELAGALNLHQDSVGTTRARCLEHLRRVLDEIRDDG